MASERFLIWLDVSALVLVSWPVTVRRAHMGLPSRFRILESWASGMVKADHHSLHAAIAFREAMPGSCCMRVVHEGAPNIG